MRQGCRNQSLLHVVRARFRVPSTAIFREALLTALARHVLVGGDANARVIIDQDTLTPVRYYKSTFISNALFRARPSRKGQARGSASIAVPALLVVVLWIPSKAQNVQGSSQARLERTRNIDTIAAC